MAFELQNLLHIHEVCQELMDHISNSAPQSFALIQSDVVTLCAVVPHTYTGTAC